MKKGTGIFWKRILPWIVFIHCLFFIVFWLTNRLFYDSVNTFLTEKTGIILDFVSICLLFAVVVGLAVIVMAIEGRKKTKNIWVILASVLGIFFLVFFYGSFFVLFSQDPNQPLRLWRLIRYNALFINGSLLAIFVILCVLFVLPRLKKESRFSDRSKVFLLAGSIIIFLLLWIPAFWILPGSVIRHELPQKPLLIGHRGAAALAPENTIASASLAHALGAAGVETDIRISQDGVLFLMHDASLLRTTDINTIFPGRAHQNASNFNWADLQKLNAGAWFAKTDPFGTIHRGEVSEADLNIYSQEGIPSLQDELNLVKQDGLLFIFDLLAAPQGHPFYDSFFDICLAEIEQAGIGDKTWFLLDPGQIPVAREKIPDMIPTYGADSQNPPEVNFLKENGYQVVNVGFGLPDEWIQKYLAAGLDVNLYVVDEPWMFSDLWQKGVTSMTTNNVEVMARLEKPIGSMQLDVYLFIWTAIGLAGLIALVLIFSLKK